MKQNEVHMALSGRIRLTLFIFALIAAGLFGSKAMPKVVAAVNGKPERKLPIYCVDTEEKKVSLSFDAAWGASKLRKHILLIDNIRCSLLN